MSAGPVAIVTGGCQGLGAAICTTLLKDGYKVCVADVQEDKGTAFVERQQEVYGSENVMFCRCDVTKESDFERAFDLTLKKFNKVDVLLNNAGILREEDPIKVLEVNLMGTMTGCLLAMKYMGKSGGGKGGIVINTASIAGFLPCPPIPVYTASKHAVIGLTRSYGSPLYLAKEGVIFMAFCPSLVATDMITDLNRCMSGAGLDNYGKSECMSPDFIAQAVKKLLEDKINGSTMCVTTEGGYQYIGYQKEFDSLLELDKSKNIL